MLATLLAAGIIGQDTGGGGEGVVNVPASRLVTFPALPSTVVLPGDLPIGAPSWGQHFDPSDRVPYAVDFSLLLAPDETIASIQRISVSATGAAVGFEVDESAGRAPIYDTASKRVQLWFIVDPSFQANTAYRADGIRVGVSVLVRTTSDPFKEVERTAVLTVRQQ